jgi:cytochrome c peroxidase
MTTSNVLVMVVVLAAVVACNDSSDDILANDDLNNETPTVVSDSTENAEDIAENTDENNTSPPRDPIDPSPVDPPPEEPTVPRLDKDGLPLPNLSINHDYEAYLNARPSYYMDAGARFGNVIDQDNTPSDNQVTNAGAMLGRVLFYDFRLSANNTVACASCHIQQHGFSDPEVLSNGFDGGKTGRHSMALTNATYYSRGRFFWDERASTLEKQVLMPIQDSIEMGMNLFDLEVKLGLTSFYAPLFLAAFGDDAITSDRISRALAQFIRSMVSYDSKYDQAFTVGGSDTPDFSAVFSDQELLGLRLFSGVPDDNSDSLGCDTCHDTSAHAADNTHVNGLDANTSADQGAGGGFFKVPSLRNIAVRAPYMHDGRFSNLAEVIEFYNSGVQAHPNLAPALRRRNSPNGRPVQFNLNQAEKEALVVFLEALTDEAFLVNPIFSNPFPEVINEESEPES